VYLVFDLGLDPMNLIFDLDLYILNIYLRTKMQFLHQGFHKLELKQNRRHTDRCDWKYIYAAFARVEKSPVRDYLYLRHVKNNRKSYLAAA